MAPLSDDALVDLFTQSPAPPPRIREEAIQRGAFRMAPKLAAVFGAAKVRPEPALRAMELFIELQAPRAIELILANCAKAGLEAATRLLASLGVGAFEALEEAVRDGRRPALVRRAALGACAEIGRQDASRQKQAVRLLRSVGATSMLESFGVSDEAPAPPPKEALTLEVWALRQTAPFPLEAAIDAVSTSVEDASRRLAEHPQIVEWQGRYFTPRIAAANFAFVIRRMDFEFESRSLVVGHRFVPFQRREGGPVTLKLSKDRTLESERASLEEGDLRIATRLLAGRSDTYELDLPPDVSQERELQFRCVDFDRAVYAVQPKRLPLVPFDRLKATLAAIVKKPPAGPVTAARQMLQVVARCFDPAKAIGPLAPILGATPEIRVSGGSFVARGKGDFMADLEELLEGQGYSDGDLKQVTWDSATLSFVGTVRSHWGMREVSIGLSPVRASCDCPQGARFCPHERLVVEELVRRLRYPDDPLVKQIRADLDKPAWRRGLESLDAALKSAAEREAPASRLTWRITNHEGSLQVEAFLQKRTATEKWSAGRRIETSSVTEGVAWATPADVAFARGYPRTLEPLVGHPLASVDGRPATVERAPLRLRMERKGGLRFALEAGGLTGVPILDPKGLLFIDWQAARIVFAPVGEALARVITQIVRLTDVPAEADADVLARVPHLERLLPVEMPAELAGQKIEADGRLVLRLTPNDYGVEASMRAVPLPGGPAVVPGDGAGRLFGIVEGKRVFVERALDAERAKAVSIAESLDLAAPPWEWRIPSDDAALDLLVKLEGRGDVVVEWPDGAMTLTRAATARDLRVDVTEDRDWFGLDGSVTIDGESVPLRAVLDAVRDGRRYVRIKGTKWLRIADLFRDRLKELADVAHGPSGMQVAAVAAPVVHELMKEAGTLKACAAWAALETRFQTAMALSPEPSAAFAAELRGYQLDGYRWLSRLAAWGVGGCLADDMGLGKTVQALALLVDRAASGPALVACPTSVATNWVRETARFAPTLKPVLYRETDRGDESNRFAAGDLVVISYGLLMRDVEALARTAWGTLVLDEAQFVKNSQTKTAAAIRQIASGWRLALTGTPIENHLGELWSLFRAVSPGVFGSWDRFRERFAAPIEKDKDASRRAALSRVVRPFILRRTKAEVLQELPARTEIRLEAELTLEERQLYEAERLAAVASLATPASHPLSGASQGSDGRFQVLAALTRLRQMACHPRLLYPERQIESSKLRVFLETVEELREGRHRALVFSQFVRYLTLVRAALDERGVKYQYLDGSTPPKARDAAVDAFQRGEGELFLISLKAGGTGLNLTAADYVIHLDPWWNPSVEDQATDRAHRIGQTRPVTVYRIVATGTVEEKILALHGSKRELVAGVLEGTGAAASLTVAEMKELLQASE